MSSAAHSTRSLCQLLAGNPEDFALGFFGIEPQEVEMRILGDQKLAAGADFAEQATAGVQVLGSFVKNAAYDLQSVFAGDMGDDRFVSCLLYTSPSPRD